MAAAGSEEALFKGRQFDEEIIFLCVRWYLRDKLGSRDLVEVMAEAELSWCTPNFALGAALRAGIRATLEPICPVSGRLMAV